jgi:hypothetical protein
MFLVQKNLKNIAMIMGWNINLSKLGHFSKMKFHRGRTKQSWTKLKACCLKAMHQSHCGMK